MRTLGSTETTERMRTLCSTETMERMRTMCSTEIWREYVPCVVLRYGENTYHV